MQTLILDDPKRRIAHVYNLAAPGYDKPAVQFFQRAAARLVAGIPLQPGQRVLDIATGTGAALLSAARVVGPQGRVIGIDIAAEMLAQAAASVAEAELNHVELRLGDAEALAFGAGEFDAVLCASSIFFLPNMAGALREWGRVTRPGGWVAFSGYGASAFQPLSDMFEARLRQFGVTFPKPRRPFGWQRLSEKDQYYQIMDEAGLVHCCVGLVQVGYYLRNVNEWWDIVWNSGFRGPVSQLGPEALAAFKAEHLADVSALATENGIWLDVPVILARGQTREGQKE